MVLAILAISAALYLALSGGPELASPQAADNHASHEATANALANETSPYLLQHAHNPVDWYPWGPVALKLAHDTDRPIFLSIGYSACYWCHVMEREVFTNHEIAYLMNRWFVNIKVDREERPDLDEIYMTATQVIAQHGGWPNSVFLTPDLKPFFAGTYFPPEDKFGRPGFPRVLTSISDAWANRREAVEAQAEQITQVIKQLQEGTGQIKNPEGVNSSIVNLAFTSLTDRFDPDNAGFGSAPKFPPDTSLDLLLTYYKTHENKSALELVQKTLRAMAYGGITDHLGGGFHRYATDEAWRIPHFEKMLYNQALLVGVYARAFKTTQDPLFADTVNRTLSFVSRELTGAHGGFYSALDAETNAVEGLYYLWHESEIRAALGAKADGFFEHFTLEAMSEKELGAVIQRKDHPSKPKLRDTLDELLVRRSARDRPRLDDKVIAGWNGLMIAGLADAYAALGNLAYLESAQACWEHLRTRQRTPHGRLYRTFRNGIAKGEAYQEDYAFVIRGLLSIYNATNDRKMLKEAVRLQEIQDELFWDETGSAYFFTSGSEPLIVRQKDTRDSAIPSGNAEAVHNLIALSDFTGDPTYRIKSGRILSRYAAQMKANPASHSRMVHGVIKYLRNVPDENLSSSKVVTASAALKRTVEGYTLSVDLRIQPGWHINANPASDPSLIPTEIIVPSGQITIVDIAYPPPELLMADFVNESIAVYSGRVRLTAEITHPGNLDGNETFVLHYQACDASRCLLPSEIELQPVIVLPQ
jgi:uncharacterized protein YyaL (SSP411 family)